MPIFWVVLRDGGEWTVEAEWPDGTVENVYAFNHQFEARAAVGHLVSRWQVLAAANIRGDETLRN